MQCQHSTCAQYRMHVVCVPQRKGVQPSSRFCGLPRLAAPATCAAWDVPDYQHDLLGCYYEQLLNLALSRACCAVCSAKWTAALPQDEWPEDTDTSGWHPQWGDR